MRMGRKTGGTKASTSGQLQRDAGKHSVPGFLEKSSVPTAQAGSYANWDKRTGASEKGRTITLPK